MGERKLKSGKIEPLKSETETEMEHNDCPPDIIDVSPLAGRDVWVKMRLGWRELLIWLR